MELCLSVKLESVPATDYTIAPLEDVTIHLMTPALLPFFDDTRPTSQLDRLSLSFIDNVYIMVDYYQRKN